ncbi:hypothetical protein IAU59_005560 [Kwoniella sp. CBS 9459]
MSTTVNSSAFGIEATAASTIKTMDDISYALDEEMREHLRNKPLEQLYDRRPLDSGANDQGHDPDADYVEKMSESLASSFVRASTDHSTFVTKEKTSKPDQYGVNIAVPRSLIQLGTHPTLQSALSEMATEVGKTYSRGVVMRAAAGVQTLDNYIQACVHRALGTTIDESAFINQMMSNSRSSVYRASRPETTREMFAQKKASTEAAKDNSSHEEKESTLIPVSLEPSTVNATLPFVRERVATSRQLADQRAGRPDILTVEPPPARGLADWHNMDDPRKQRRATTDSLVIQAFEEASAPVDLTSALLPGQSAEGAQTLDVKSMRLSTYDLNDYPTAAHFAPTAEDAERLVALGAAASVTSGA